MITRIIAHNFKCFKDLDVEIRPLTLMCGLNGSGKSSAIQIVTCLTECVKKEKDGASVVDLSTPRSNLGPLSEIFYRFDNAEDDKIRMSVQVETHDNGGELRTMSTGIDFTYTADSGGTDKLLIKSHDSSSHGNIDTIINVKRLSSVRVAPKSLHDYSETAVRNCDIGLNGEHAVSYLLAHGEDVVANELSLRGNSDEVVPSRLSEQVDSWIKIISPDVAVKVYRSSEIGKVQLAFEYRQNGRRFPFRPENVGAGLSIVLPVLIMALTAKKGDCLIIENPESDLHPKGQVEIAMLLSRLINLGVQVIMETHSDHIINGIRLAIKTGLIDSSHVKVLFFERSTSANVSPIEIDEDGGLSHYPLGFLDTWGDLIDRIMEGNEASSNDDYGEV